MLAVSQKASTSRNIPLDATLKSPKPGHHLHLNKPLPGNASNVSVNDIVPPSTPTPGLRAHLGQLLPRHALFRAKIVIHQISSVPFVGGEFGVRWKFKSVQAPNAQKQGLLQRVKSRNGSRTDKGKGREDLGAEGVLSPAAPAYTTASSSSTHASSSVSSRSSEAADSQHLSADWPSTPSGSSFPASSNNSSAITLAPPASLVSLSPIPVSSTPARGMTPFLKLKDHSVVWSQTLDSILKFDIDRETTQVLPNPLKLVVMQHINHEDPHGSPQNPRLGAVYLNLAEYINKGNVERRYLLKESKTNATLKISIEMEYISGETNYIPPALSKGEILAGIAGFLDKEVVKRRPRALDLYGPYKDQEELEIDLLGTSKSARIPKTAKSERKIPTTSNLHDSFTTDTAEDEEEEEEDLESEDMEEEQVGVAFDVRRLPYAYGTKTTEMLIDALFNPAKTSLKHEESPFTVYEPPSPVSSHSAGITPRVGASSMKPAGVGLGMRGVPLDRHETIGKRHGSTTTASSSVYSTSDSSVHTSTSSSSKSRSRGRGSQSDSHHGHSVAFAVAGGGAAHAHAPRGTPEGRVVVPPRQEEDTSMGGLRGWWKRQTGSTHKNS